MPDLNIYVRQFIFISFMFCVSLLHAQQINQDSITNILHSATDKEKINILNNSANQFKYNNPDIALEYAKQAIELSKKIGDPELQARNETLAAGILFNGGNFNKSKDYYTSAYTYFSNTKNEKTKVEILNSLSSINYAQGNLTAAVEGYLNVLRYYEDLNDNAGMLNVLGSLATLYTKQNNFSKAIEYNLRAIRIYEESSDKLRTLVSYDNIGNIYLHQGNYPKAKEYFSKSLKLYTEINNKAGKGYTLNQLGDIEMKLNNYDEALNLYNRSFSIAEELKMQPLIVSDLNDLGEVYFNLRRYDAAIKCYTRAINISKNVGMKIELDNAYKGLSIVYKITNELDKSKTYHALSSEIRDSLFNDSIMKLNADISLRFEAEKKQHQIELMSKEQTLKDSDLLRERLIRNISVVAFIILLIVIFFLIFFFVQNKKIAVNLEKQKNELEKKNKEIMEQTEKLNQLNAVKDRFFSIISHDLRNNLSTMKLYFDLISHPEYRESDYKEVTKSISHSVENTIDLLENLLIWASAQIKGVPIHIQKINIHSLTQENVNLLHNAAFEKEIELINEIAEDITAYGDMDVIRLVLRNLIANAIKFTRKNGLIKISAGIENEVCKITVSDNGVGISRESIDRLFNQFLNPTTKGTGNEKGTGLGLILCKDFVERNNGKIWVESEEGVGSKFIFTLPAKG